MSPVTVQELPVVEQRAPPCVALTVYVTVPGANDVRGVQLTFTALFPGVTTTDEGGGAAASGVAVVTEAALVPDPLVAVIANE